MKKYGKLSQTAEITLCNEEWKEADREHILTDAETLLFEKIGKLTDAVEMEGKIEKTDNSIVFLVNYYNYGTREFYPGGHDFDGKQEDIDELDVNDPEDEIFEYVSKFQKSLDCEVSFITIDKEWKEN